MKKTTLLTLMIAAGLSLAAPAQTLLYQWAFTNLTDTVSNSAPSYAFTPGTGSLLLGNVTGNIFTAGVGADGVNPVLYFTNSNAGPGFGPGVDATGALVANGQGYNSGNSGVAVVTNLNLGSLNKITVTFWFQMGTGVPGQFPRIVQFSQTPAYDIGNKGSGAHNDIGASINSGSGLVQMQNTVANASSAQGTANAVTGLSNFPSGLPADNTTWIFEALTYDGTLPANQFVTWLGTTSESVESIVQQANFGFINFTTNATVLIGNDDVAGTARGLSQGAIADVRIYSGVLTSNMVDNIRQFLPDGVIPPGNTNVTLINQPVSGRSFVAGTRTLNVVAAGIPANFSYLWRSNGVPVVGGTNSSLTLSNLQLSANGATFICSVTNYLTSNHAIYTGTNSLPATLTVLTPVPGSYAEAIYTNQPSSFWLVNEPSNSVPFAVFDYANGNDGAALTPTNLFYPNGPTSPAYPGFPSGESAIGVQANYQASYLEMADPVNFPNTGMTICGWVWTPVTPSANGLIYDLVSDTGGGYGLVFNGPNTVSYQWGQNAPASGFTSGVSFNSSEWTFVALVVSTNLTPDDLENDVTADTNATLYVGGPSIGLTTAIDSTALSGDLIGSGTSAGSLALGRTASAASDNGSHYQQNNVAFNGVAVFYSALSPQTITNLYLKTAGLALSVAPDPYTPGNVVLTYPLGTLNSAPAVTGPYTPVSDAYSTMSIPASLPRQFFRVTYP